jgi:hypothetical protein
MSQKKYKPGGFYWERELYQSDAFLSLNKNAMKVLIAILDSRQRESKDQAKDKKGRQRKPKFINLDRLIVPYGLIEKIYHVPHGRIPPAFDELFAKGFLKIVYHGGRSKHDTNRYAWSDNYLLWTPNTAPFEVRPRREKHGYQGKATGARKGKAKVVNIRQRKS